MRLALVQGRWGAPPDHPPSADSARGAAAPAEVGASRGVAAQAETETADAWTRQAGDPHEADAVRPWAVQAGVGLVEHAAPGPRAKGALADLLSRCDVAWCHAVPREQMDDDDVASLRAWVAQGNRLLLSLDSASWGAALGDAGDALEIARARWRDEDDPHWPASFRTWPDYPHIRGFQGWRGERGQQHPLFDGFVGGTFTWRATEGEAVTRVILPAAAAEGRGARVLAMDRAYVQLLADLAVAWEVSVGSGTVLCLGAHVCLTMHDTLLVPQRDRLLANALTYLADRPPVRERMYWPLRSAHAGVTLLPTPLPLAAEDGASTEDRRSPRPPRWQQGDRVTGVALSSEEQPWIVDPVASPLRDVGSSGDDSGLASVLARRADSKLSAASAFTLTGTRALVVGTLSEGIRDIWIHPLCVVSGGVSYDATRLSKARVTPGDVARELVDRDGATWIEQLVVSPDGPTIHLSLTPQGVAADSEGLELTLDLPLRLSWPMPANALQPLRAELRTRGELGTIAVTGRDRAHVAMIRIDGARAIDLTDATDRPRLRVLTGLGPLRLTFSASTDGMEALIRDALATSGAAASHRKRIARTQRDSPDLSVPDAALGDAFASAVQRLAAFRADAPGGWGQGLMAGFAATGQGWRVSRGGYAWFFGRDTCWCVDALLASGQFELARASIALLAGTADITGKIVHELTTSGVAHYDAADATPLFLRAVAAYAEWTGDLEAVRGWWPAVERAFHFVASCDRDGDGLPENTNVGHGWVEDGPLGGGAVTSYVAAIWVDALRRLRPLAERVGSPMAPAVAGALERAAAGVDGLRDQRSGRLALHRGADGRLLAEITALAAVPVALGVDRGAAAHLTMGELAQPRFTAPWGLRMLPTDHPHYTPRGYHAGSVWPLFTGWASLADFAIGRGASGLARVVANARGLGAAAVGAFAEVLDGDTGAAAGVCPDQAWSAAMVVAPLVSGLFGVHPVAYEGRCTIAPYLPLGWAAMRLGGREGGLRVGDSRLEISVARDETSAPRVTSRCTQGPRVELEILPLPR